jgi:hypothetical protein
MAGSANVGGSANARPFSQSSKLPKVRQKSAVKAFFLDLDTKGRRRVL